jgi:hypothetical protein
MSCIGLIQRLPAGAVLGSASSGLWRTETASRTPADGDATDADCRAALPRFTVTTVGCLPGQQVTTYRAGSFAVLGTGLLRLRSPSPATVVNVLSPVPGPEAVESDPVANGGLPGTTGGCRVMNTTTDPGVAAWTWTPRTHLTLAGAPVVHVTVGLDGELAARLWDADPATGKQALITRGVYRLTAPAPGRTRTLAFQLWPAAWALGAGHQLKLELTPDDSPTWRPDNLPATMTLTHISLTIPTRASQPNRNRQLACPQAARGVGDQSQLRVLPAGA